MYCMQILTVICITALTAAFDGFSLLDARDVCITGIWMIQIIVDYALANECEVHEVHFTCRPATSPFASRICTTRVKYSPHVAPRESNIVETCEVNDCYAARDRMLFLSKCNIDGKYIERD